MKRNHIVVVRITTRIYPDIEGTGPAKQSYILSKYSSGSGIKIINIACTPKGQKLGDIKRISPNFEIHYLPISPPAPSEKSIFKILIFSVLFLFYSLKELLAINRKEKINLIHAHSPSISGLVAVIFCVVFSYPLVYTYHGFDYRNITEFYFQSHIVNKIAKKIVLITKKMEKYFSFLKESIKKKIIVIPNCVECLSKSQHCVNRSDYERVISNINIEQINIGTRNITYVGQMVFEQKVQGMVDFLKAFDEFLNEWTSPEKKKLRLIFIGGGPYIKILLEAHSRSTNKDQILILGYRTDVENFHAISELSALTSYTEGFPNAILESMVMGVPCIGSDVGEIREIIGDTGFIIKSGDIPAIKNALFRYFSDLKLQEELKINCFKRVKTLYCCNKIGKRYNILYKKICSSSVSR